MVSCAWQFLKCSLIRMVTIVIVISGNPVLSRSFQVTVKTRLDNYLGNLSNMAMMGTKMAPIHWETEQGWLHRWVAAG